MTCQVVTYMFVSLSKWISHKLKNTDKEFVQWKIIPSFSSSGVVCLFFIGVVIEDVVDISSFVLNSIVVAGSIVVTSSLVNSCVDVGVVCPASVVILCWDETSVVFCWLFTTIAISNEWLNMFQYVLYRTY